jgi:hypothetical protein
MVVRTSEITQAWVIGDYSRRELAGAIIALNRFVFGDDSSPFVRPELRMIAEGRPANKDSGRMPSCIVGGNRYVLSYYLDRREGFLITGHSGEAPGIEPLRQTAEWIENWIVRKRNKQT